MTNPDPIFDVFSFAELNDYERELPPRTVTATIELRLRPELLQCDECGSQADAVHFLGQADDWPRQGERIEVWFSCRRHDPGGYWLYLSDLASGDSLEHTIARKRWGLYGLAALDDRLEEIDAIAFRAFLERRRAA